MTRQKTFILIPLVIVAGLLIYCWSTILTNDLPANWRHYTGLALFFVLAFLFFNSLTKTILATGIISYEIFKPQRREKGRLALRREGRLVKDPGAA